MSKNSGNSAAAGHFTSFQVGEASSWRISEQKRRSVELRQAQAARPPLSHPHVGFVVLGTDFVCRTGLSVARSPSSLGYGRKHVVSRKPEQNSIVKSIRLRTPFLAADACDDRAVVEVLLRRQTTSSLPTHSSMPHRARHTFDFAQLVMSARSTRRASAGQLSNVVGDPPRLVAREGASSRAFRVFRVNFALIRRACSVNGNSVSCK